MALAIKVMIPPSARNDSANCAEVNFVLRCEFFSQGGVTPSDVFYLILRKFAACKKALAFLFYHILKVRGISAQKQMRWINARRVVAVVQNQCSNWNTSSVNDPTDPARADKPRARPSDPEHPVAVICYECRPRPAWVIRFFINLFPKSGFKSLGETLSGEILLCNVFSHIKSFLMCLAPGRFNGAGAPPILSVHRKWSIQL